MIIILSDILCICAFLASASSVRLPETWVIPVRYEKMRNHYADNPDTEQIGWKNYKMHCSSCHGKKGLGDGKKAINLATSVPDLTDASIQSQSEGAIYYKFIVGRDDMPSFEKTIVNEEDRWLLVNYIRNLK